MVIPSIVYFALTGCGFFFSSHYLCRTMFHLYFSDRLDKNACYRVSTKAISMLNAIFAVIVATHSILVCNDIMKDKDEWMSLYIDFGLTYFVYDLYVMYVGQRLTDITQYKSESKTSAKDFPSIWFTIRRFFQKEGTIIVHHIVFTVLGVPLVRMLRFRIGDYIVACFFLAELSTPFLSIRAILHEFKISNGVLYAVNGVMFIITFFLARVVCVPFVYWRYATYKQISIYNVPQMIPLHCNILSLAFLVLQLYWFSIILRTFRRRLGFATVAIQRPKFLLHGLKGLIATKKYEKHS